MTRIVGSTIIKCPDCCKEYRTPRYGSINLTGMEEWSDGFACGLYSTTPSVCICDCFALFLRAKAPIVGFVPRPEPKWTAAQEANLPEFMRIPNSLQKDADAPVPWWNAIGGLFKKDPRRLRIRDATSEKIQELRWPALRYIGSDDVKAVLGRASSLMDPDLEIAVRRDCWRERNDRRRWSQSPAGLAIPLDELETDNLEKLLALLLKQMEKPIAVDGLEGDPTQTAQCISDLRLEISEIERVLGLFDAALKHLLQVDKCHDAKLCQLTAAATAHRRALIKFE